MNRLELNERFAQMWRRSREDAGKSQEYMSKYLGVSRKTIQNWEDGTSSPNQLKALEWFEALNLQPLPYYLWALYPKKFNELNDAEIDKTLIDIVHGLPLDLKKKLLFMLAGNHGSSTVGMLELATAHLHVPLEKRINIAQVVATNYELAAHKKTLTCPDDVQPDLVTLNRSIELGTKAVLMDKNSYTTDL